MKKVIFKKRTEEVYLSDLNDDSIIGIQWKTGVKTFVVNSNDGFVGCGKLSTLGSWEKDSKKEYVKTAIEQKPEIFVFETEKELFKWLSE